MLWHHWVILATGARVASLSLLDLLERGHQLVQVSDRESLQAGAREPAGAPRRQSMLFGIAIDMQAVVDAALDGHFSRVARWGHAPTTIGCATSSARSATRVCSITSVFYAPRRSVGFQTS